MAELREVPTNKSCQRPHLLLGADRRLVLLLALVVGLLVYSLQSFFGLVFSFVLWVGVMWILTRMGKADPMMQPVLLRHWRYQEYYPARSGLKAQAPMLPRTWGRLF